MSSFARTFAVTAAAFFLFAIDRLAVATVLPQIAADLGARITGLEWIVNAFTLAFAALLLAGAALGDRFGRRRMLVAGVGVFTAGSALAAVAPTTGVLVGARAVQGAGGALLVPLSLTLLSAATPPERRGAVLGAYGIVGAVATAIGPVLGGALTEAASWQAIFWVNVPLGAGLAVMARRWLPESHGPRVRLDVPGAALGTGALLALVWGLVETAVRGWADPAVAGTLALGGTLLAAFVAWERRAPAPALPMRFFAARAFSAAGAAAVLGYAGLIGTLFLVAQLLQNGLGDGPVTAGAHLLPLAAAMALTARVAGRRCDHHGPRAVMAAALLLEVVGLVALALGAHPGAGYPALLPGLVLVGMAGAALFAPVQSMMLGAVPPEDQGKASGAVATLREVGGVLGVSVLAGVFATFGGSGSPAEVLDGIRPALLVGALAATGGMGAALLAPAPRRVGELEPAPA